MINVELHYIYNKDGNVLRTPSVKGKTDILPLVGEAFVMVGTPLDTAADCRLVNTNIVTEIMEETSEAIVFKTASESIYKVEYGK